MQHNQSWYRRWRETRLALKPRSDSGLRVDIDNPAALSVAERTALQNACRRHNFAVFRLKTPAAEPTAQLGALGLQLGLHRLDRNLCAEHSGLSALTVAADTLRSPSRRYIPYTNHPLSWHTDGYYNAPQRQIRAWLLYCAQDAASGGENAVLNHEIAYVRLRDHDPALLEALMSEDTFTVPANQERGVEIRGAQAGPVFSWLLNNAGSPALHMRYSARQRNIEWRDDPSVQAAAAFLLRLFSEGDDHIFDYRLAPGEGLISNNALHRRSGFVDDPANGRKRLVYRARYFDRIANT